MFSVIMAVADFTGGSLKGKRDPEVDEYERKVALRTNRRRPIEETIAEVGEGRCELFNPGPYPYPPVLTFAQLFALLVTRSGGDNASRRRTGLTSRLSPQTPMLHKQ